MSKFLSIFALLFTTNAFALVDMKNANYAETWTDLMVPGSGYELRVQRTYNSRSLFNGIFGFGWCSDFETRLEVTAESNLMLTECGGGLEIPFTPKATTGSGKVDDTIKTIVSEVKKRNSDLSKKYFEDLEKELKENNFLRDEFSRQLKLKGKITPGTTFHANGRDVENILMKNNEYIRTMPDGTYQKFNMEGHLTFLYDRNGNYLKLEWKGSQLISVVDNNGRKLNFKYNPANKKVQEISGPNGLVAKYKFVGEDLKEATNSWKATFKHEYDDLHNMTKIEFPDKTTKTLTYNKDRDWVTAFKDRRGCTETYSYDVDKEDPKNHYWSTVVKKCGKEVTNKSTYEFFHRMRRDGLAKYLYRVRSDVNDNVTDITYHEVFGKPVTVTRNKETVIYNYFDNGLVKSRRDSQKQMNFEYKNSCQKVSEVATYILDPKKPDLKKPAKIITTKFIYEDKKCNLSAAQNSEGQSVKIQYDARGRIAVIEDQSKKIVKIKYEERFGKPWVVTRPGLGTITVSYKSDGQIDKVDSKEGPNVAVQVASIFNNLLDIIAPATAEANL